MTYKYLMELYEKYLIEYLNCKITFKEFDRITKEIKEYRNWLDIIKHNEYLKNNCKHCGGGRCSHHPE